MVGGRCPVVRDWDDLFALRPDGIFLATPPAAHAAVARAAIAARIPVLVEKPLTLDLGQAESLQAEAHAASAIVHVDHIDLVNPLWRSLRRALPRLGPIQTLRGTWANWGPLRADTPGRWDYGAHAIAAALHAAGEEPAHATGRSVLRAGPRELVTADLVWASGTTAHLTYGNGAVAKIRRMEIACLSGTAVYDDVAGTATVSGARLPHSRQSPLRAAIVRFAAAIRRERADLADLDLGVAVVRTLVRLDASLAKAR